MSEMESFLATIELFRELGPAREIAPLCQVEHFAGYERLNVRRAAAQTN
jgi:hypothetical protein